MKKLTTEEFIQKAKHIHGDKYDYSLVEYKDAHTKVKIICPIHGEFEQTPAKHTLGQECVFCSHRSYKYTTQEFIEKAKQVHGITYDYSLVEYINNDSKVKIICLTHGEFEQTPKNHLKGQDCPKCSHYSPKEYTTQEFIEKAKQVHGITYDYSLVEYTGILNKVKIVCSIHGEFEQMAREHLVGKGCKFCGYIKSSQKQRFTTQEFIEKADTIHKNKYDYGKVEYKGSEGKVKIICPKHGEFEQVAENHLAGSGCTHCANGNTSKPEKEVADWLRSLNINVIANSKKIIPPLELDIFLPDFNLAIEYNGLYWHSFSQKGKTSHRDKWIICQEKGIDLIQMWSSEWEEKKEICQSIILNRLGRVNRIMARKCEFKSIPINEAKKLFDENHLQGFTRCDYYYGLYYNNELVSGIEVNRSRFNKDYDWEIVRHVNKIGTSVSGGFSKLIKHFKEEHPGTIIDYCDQRWFNGKGHSNAGFIEKGITQPDLHYTDYQKVITRNKFFGKKWVCIDESVGKYENLLLQGFDRIYGVGKKVYILV